MRQINKIIFHCSDSPDDRDIGFKEINSWHKARGFTSPSGVHCGYHFIIRRDGTVEMGRHVSEVGAHVEGANRDSIGICLVGSHKFDQKQIKSAQNIVDSLGTQFPQARLYGHCEFPSAKRQGKTCPNFDVNTLKRG